MKLKFLLFFVFIAFNVTNATRPTYSDIIKGNGGSRNDIIRAYFERGYSYKDICAFLQTLHNITLSVAGLKKALRRMCLKRRLPLNRLKLLKVVRAINEERSDSGINSMNQVNSVKTSFNCNKKYSNLFEKDTNRFNLF